LGIDGKKTTFFPAASNKNVALSVRNLPTVTIVEATNASTYDLLNAEVLLFEKDGLKNLNDQLAVN
jgi:ribosomal protein L4